MAHVITEAEALEILKQKGSLYPLGKGYHFKGTSGKHIGAYCNIDPVLPFIKELSAMTEAIVSNFYIDDIETVIVPATGGIPLSQWGPYHLMKKSGGEVLGVWADKAKPEGFAIERDGFEKAIDGKRVLLLEDIINTSYSIKKVIDLVRSHGGNIVGVGALIAGPNTSAESLGVDKFFNLVTFTNKAWEEDACELCDQNIPMIVDIGHGDKFAAENPSYPTVEILKN
jgi:orotate phosphoribosyltransferase